MLLHILLEPKLPFPQIFSLAIVLYHLVVVLLLVNKILLDFACICHLLGDVVLIHTLFNCYRIIKSFSCPSITGTFYHLLSYSCYLEYTLISVPDVSSIKYWCCKFNSKGLYLLHPSELQVLVL